ncbi:TPA: hypothetical protein ACSY83_04500 [Listeria monocytogenes]|nr:hypothetical protein [Listeria monocytogenes]EGY4474165.1 hypothetical protein [Listeria monocytogenes]EHC2906441.1 hypothetical protein [Listeria monocytogenes]EIZ6617253.1 hypothetical protein [Listeria monocytogenes]EKZ3809872.1 hypothetical protein [Listeria monocytogenes]
MNKNSTLKIFNDRKAMHSIQIRLNKNVFYRYCVASKDIEQKTNTICSRQITSYYGRQN